MDIVERLRFGVALDEQGDVSWCNQEAMINAADEIERLREALQNIADGPRDVEKSYVSLLHEVQSEARKALGDE